MERFAALVETLQEVSDRGEQVRHIADFLAHAAGDECAWAVWLLLGHGTDRQMTQATLKQWSAEASGFPEWLVEVSTAATGNVAEMASLILPSPVVSSSRSLAAVMSDLDALCSCSLAERKEGVFALWQELSPSARHLVNLLLEGKPLLELPQCLVSQAVALQTGASASLLEHRFQADWNPRDTSLAALTEGCSPEEDHSRHHPFHAPRIVERSILMHEDPQAWVMEWLLDGPRAQLVKRRGEVFLWSEIPELVSAQFPAILESATDIPDGTVLAGSLTLSADGRCILGWPEEKRGTPIMVVDDILEEGGTSLAAMPLEERRGRLTEVVKEGAQSLVPSKVLAVTRWEELEAMLAGARLSGALGVMLRRRDSLPGLSTDGLNSRCVVGVKRLCIHGVLMNVDTSWENGQGGFSGIPSPEGPFRLTFGVWDGDRLVPAVTIAPQLSSSGVEDMTRFVAENTVQRFGPVHLVKGRRVYEIACDYAVPQARRKSGVGLRNAAVVRHCDDRSVAESSTLEDLQALLAASGFGGVEKRRTSKRG